MLVVLVVFINLNWNNKEKRSTIGKEKCKVISNSYGSQSKSPLIKLLANTTPSILLRLAKEEKSIRIGRKVLSLHLIQSQT